jgi:hypothetical protein
MLFGLMRILLSRKSEKYTRSIQLVEMDDEDLKHQ